MEQEGKCVRPQPANSHARFFIVFMLFFASSVNYADRASLSMVKSGLSADLGLIIEEREMIPEAAMQALDGRFRIYLQSNFKDFPGTETRRRFSLAHEIGHTLFFEQRDAELKARKDAPRGEALEAACHKAASMILVPNKALHAQLRDKEIGGTEDLVMLARSFDVSVEVIARRLQDLRAFENKWAPILTRLNEGVPLTEYAAYPHWLKPHIVAPERGMAFSEWFRGAEQPDGVLKKRVNGGSLDAIRKDVTNSLAVFELHLRD